MAASIRTDPALVVEASKPPFEYARLRAMTYGLGYDVGPDVESNGDRFLMVIGDEVPPNVGVVHLVLDWVDRLENRD